MQEGGQINRFRAALIHGGLINSITMVRIVEIVVIVIIVRIRVQGNT